MSARKYENIAEGVAHTSCPTAALARSPLVKRRQRGVTKSQSMSSDEEEMNDQTQSTFSE